MAIALVGSAGAITTVTAASVTPAFAQATTSGHLLVCVVGSFAGAANTNLTTSSSGWLLAVGSAASAAGAAIFYKPNCGAGETAPTINSGTGSTNLLAELSEWSGVATTSPVDQIGTGPDPGIVTATNAAVDAATGELAISCCFINNSKSATYTISTAWTPAGGSVTSLNNTSATKDLLAFMGSADVMSSIASADKAVWTVTPSTGTVGFVASVVASFKLPAVSTFTASPIRIADQAVNRSSVY